MPDEFFDLIYSQANGDESAVPWQGAMSRRLIAEWFDGFDPSGHRVALVVAAGLGDDAARLAEFGLDVVAFDAAPSAIGWARKRHPDAEVDWTVADLFAPPTDWHGAFDLVVEVFTIQSIEMARQREAAETIRSFVAPGGTLVVIAIVNDANLTVSGPPTPLDPATVDLLGEGWEERARYVEDIGEGTTVMRLELVRPPG